MADGPVHQTAVLLLAHGTPETLDEIPQYLMNVTSGRSLPQHVVEEIRHRYGLIGKSPLTDITFLQANSLQREVGLPVYVGMRNWKPYVVDTVRQMREAGVQRAIAICLAPQNSRTSVGLYKRAAYAEAGSALQLDFVDAWADHPLLVRAFSEKLRPRLQQVNSDAGTRVPVLFTAHSVPCRTVWSMASLPPEDADAQPPARPAAPQEPDPYPQQAVLTAELVAESLAADGLAGSDWFFAFQSQGASGGPWLGPSVEDTLTALSRAGHRRVLMQPIGFLCDHVEILYDIDIGFREFGSRIAVTVERTESLNDSPELIAALAAIVSDRLRALGW